MGTLHPAALVREAPVSIEDAGDAHLVRRTRAGDDESFAELYRRYRSSVYEVCLRRLRDPVAADDVTQDTFLRAYSNLHRFDDARRLLPWLIAIATRRCIDVQRRGSRTEASDEIEDFTTDGCAGDPTLDAVVAGEERRRLERALRRLAPRQRRALLLHAVEGWSYADIAAAEGVTVASTKSLLFHARENLRRACRRGLLATLLIPAGAVRDRMRRTAGELRSRYHSAVEPVLGASGTALSSGITALVLAVAGSGAPVAPGGVGPVLSAMPTATVTTRGPVWSGNGNLELRAAPAPDMRPVPLTGPLLDPARGARPEDTRFTSFAPSPSYERDHTILAAGTVPCSQSSCAVLFRSRDQGASWTRLRARSFRGYRLLLPPAYPADGRIFAMSAGGLQVSTDAGESFKIAYPAEGEAAISPMFNKGDPRILIAAGTVFEYWANDGLVKPASLVAPAGLRLTVAFSPSFPQDERFLVGGLGVDATGVQRPSIHRCAGVMCDQSLLPAGSGVPQIRLSSKFGADRVGYVFTPDALLRSVDGGASFEAATKPGLPGETIQDLVFLGPSGRSMLAAVQAQGSSSGGVYRSLDGGRTWTGGRVGAYGFESGVATIVVVGDRLFAAGIMRGLACSSDGGRSWAAGCAA